MGPWLPTKLAILLLALLSGRALADVGAFNRHLQQEIVCNNTQSGRWYITDDRGMVCPRESLNYATGCCADGEMHSCASCEREDKCCSMYEYCVSCCLKPENEPQKQLGSIFRGRNKPETGHWGTPFEYCRAVCRTTARSTQHENAFIADRKHCFSKLGRPQVPVPPAPPLPSGVAVVAGQPGQNCHVACGAKQMRCRGDAFPSINDCNTLRAKFMCEAGCGESAADQREFPGYVEGSAPKHLRPAFCAVLPPPAPSAAAAFNCTRGNGNVRRLCPCEPLPPGAVLPGAAGAATGTGGPAGGTGGPAGGVRSGGSSAAAAEGQQQAAGAAAAQQQATQHTGQQQPVAGASTSAQQQEEHQLAGAAGNSLTLEQQQQQQQQVAGAATQQ